MSTSLRLIFAGTPEFSAVILRALLHSSHHIVAVYTQPDRRQGRGLHMQFSSVKQLALEHQLPLHQPIHLKTLEEHDILRQHHADVMIVAAYGLILPQIVLDIPRYGCINVHPSLLPRWRGAAPIQRAIFSGDSITGTSIMQMDAGLDTGDVLHQETYEMKSNETSSTLHDTLAQQGASCLLKTLSRLPISEHDRMKQDDSQATYATKLTTEEAEIDWNLPAKTIDQRIRAFHPWPVAHTTWHHLRLKIWKAEALDVAHSHSPGTITQLDANHLCIATQEGMLRLLEVQLPGGKRLPIHDFLNSKRHALHIGERFS